MKDEIELYSSTDEYKIKQITSILTDNHIPFVLKIDGSGSYMNAYLGNSIQTKRIFVQEEMYNKAIESIAFFLTQEEVVEEDIEDRKKYCLMKRIFACAFLGLPIIAAICMIIASIFR